MKRRSLQGVTLLEIMLVLAIAALVIVMSIRFYQSASTSNKVNAGMNVLQGVVAAAENYASANGSYTDLSTGIVNYLPGNTLPSSPWGGPVEISSAAATTYTVKMNVTGATACDNLKKLVEQNKLFTATCSASDITVVVGGA